MELRDALMSVFAGRRDVYAEQYTQTTCDSNGAPVRSASWTRKNEPLTDALLDQHLAGRRTVGMYLHRPDGTVGYVVWDVDTRDHSPVLLLQRVLDDWEIDALMFDSGRKGVHLVAAFAEPVSGVLAYRFVRAIWEQAGSPEHVDLFPKQAGLAPDRPYGNLVKLPLGIHRASIQRCALLTTSFDPVAEGTEATELLGLRRVTTEVAEQVAARMPTPRVSSGSRVVRIGGTADYVHTPYKCFEQLSTAQYRTGTRDVLLFTLAKHLAAQTMPRTFAELVVERQAERCLDGQGRPAPFREWRAKVAQVYENGYTSLGCEEPAMAAYCVGAACPIYQRTHAPTDNTNDTAEELETPRAEGDDTGNVVIGDIRQIGLTNPRYRLTVCGKAHECTLEELASWRRFRVVVAPAVGQILRLPYVPGKKPDAIWDELVNDALKDRIVEPVPEDAASDEAGLAQEAFSYLRSAVNNSEEREDILAGAVWRHVDEENAEWTYFLGRFVVQAIRGKVGPLTTRALYHALHRYGVEGWLLKIAGRPHWTWRIRTTDLNNGPL